MSMRCILKAEITSLWDLHVTSLCRAASSMFYVTQQSYVLLSIEASWRHQRMLSTWMWLSCTPFQASLYDSLSLGWPRISITLFVFMLLCCSFANFWKWCWLFSEAPLSQSLLLWSLTYLTASLNCQPSIILDIFQRARPRISSFILALGIYMRRITIWHWIRSQSCPVDCLKVRIGAAPWTHEVVLHRLIPRRSNTRQDVNWKGDWARVLELGSIDGKFYALAQSHKEKSTPSQSLGK